MILASQNRSLKSTQPDDRCEPLVGVPANDGLPADLEDDARVLPAIDDILGDLARAVTRGKGNCLVNGTDAGNMTYKTAIKRDQTGNCG